MRKAILNYLSEHRLRCLFMAIGICILVLGIVFLAISKIFYISFCDDNKDCLIGIIDDKLTEKCANTVVYYGETSKVASHGEKLIKYINDKGYCGDIYYYAADDDGGNIKSDAIVDGLNYMKSKGVNKVNISLSSKYYSEELANWIKENNDVQVFL